jgi:hypothetical protein
LPRLDLSQVLNCHRLDRIVWNVLARKTTCLNSEDGAGVSHASGNREQFRDISAEAVNEEYGG